MSSQFLFPKAKMAEVLGVTIRGLDKARRNGFGLVQAGKESRKSLYDIRQAVPAWTEYQIRRRTGNVRRGKALDPVEQRARKDAAQAALAEQRHAQLSGQLIDRAEQVHEWGRLVSACRNRLLALPGALASEVVDAVHNYPYGAAGAVEQRLHAGVCEALEELSRAEWQTKV